MEDKRILDKIKKLLKLSESNNQHEASLALEKALELMEKRGLTASAVKMSEVVEHSSKPLKVQKPADYQSLLLNSILNLFGCEAYFSYEFVRGKWVTKPIIIGLDPNAEIASYCFETLSIRQEKARSEYLNGLHKNTKRLNKTQKANEFALGWAIGIHWTVKRLVPVSNVPVIVSEYHKARTEDMVSTSTRATKTGKDEKALSQGIKAGNNVDLNKPINGTQERLKLEQ